MSWLQLRAMVFIMKMCKKCGVGIADDTAVCPLCSMVLTGDDKCEPSYPDIHQKMKIIKKLIQIVCYVLVVVQIFLVVMNYYYYNGIWWSLITGGAVTYLIITLIYTFNRRDGHIKKIFVQMIAGILLLFVIDYASGANGWSLRYGMPGVILLVDAIIYVCMLINFYSWQSYILMQIFTLLLSIAYMILYLTEIVENPVLPWISFGVSAVLFSATVFFGGKKAKSELKRRFYI